ncbi:MAG: cellulase family glycosylhydrolase [Ruminococcus sp.]|nr:cellulase family glycosylhydrolase [Ruminococcus sp.]
MKLVQKAVSAATAAIMAASACAVNISTVGMADAAGSKAAIDLVNDMGLGWNLGNTFDAWSASYVNGGCPASSYETIWGNAVTTQEMISEIHKYGFNSVRIPITFGKCTDPTTFIIDEDYLARVKEVVGYCTNEGMYAIVDMHWDWLSESAGATSWLNKGLDAEAQFKSMWTQIANYFKNCDEHVVFQDMNEVWWGNNYTSATSTSYNVLNTLNKDFVDVVRATGGNNANRLLVIAGANADLTNTISSSYTVPDDEMVAVDIHYYTPSPFCVMKANENWDGITPQTTWGTAAEKAAVATDLNKLKNRFVDNNIPVIIGEYGVLTNEGKDQSSIEAFIETVAGTAYSMNGISGFLWDDSDAGGHEYFSRKNLKWWDEKIGDIYSSISKTGYKAPTIDWVETEPDEDNLYTIGNSTRLKIDFDCPFANDDHHISGTGTVSWWDLVTNSWHQNAIIFGVTSDENGLHFNELGEEDENKERPIVQYGYVNIPSDAMPTSVKLELAWFGYNRFENGEYVEWAGEVPSDSYPTISKVWIDGVVEDEPTTEPVTTEPTTEPTTDTPSNVVWGDANCNGDVNLSDAVAILQYVALPAKYALSEEGERNADVVDNGTSGINGIDALAVQMVDAKLLTTDDLPISREALSAKGK